jgi:non-ribosomal peptide synthetase component F
MTLLAAWQTTLSRQTGLEDIAVGSPIAGRDLPELEPLIGFFVNTLVFRTNLNGDPTFAEVLNRVRKVTLDAYANQAPFEKIVEALQPERDLSRQPLFQVAFALQNAAAADLRLNGLRAGPVEALAAAAKFDLTVFVNEHAGWLEGEVEYAAELFEPATIDRLIQHFVRVIEQIAANPGGRISELRLMSAEERVSIITTASGESTSFPQQCVHTLFEIQAARTPDAVAVRSGDEVISYSELDRRASALCRRLRALGVREESCVAVCLERSADLIVSMLAILKAGGIYVPLDHQYPRERLELMLSGTECFAVLTNSRLRNSIPSPLTINLDAPFDDDVAKDTDASEAPLSPDRAAYVNFTSGSTGEPKAVVVTHSGVVRLVCNTDYIQFRGSERVAHISNVSFDAATFEIWGPLLHGATVCVIPFDVVIEPNKLGARLASDRITTAFFTTALFNRLVDQCPERLAGMETLLFGGEAVDPRSVSKLMEQGFRGRLLHV